MCAKSVKPLGPSSPAIGISRLKKSEAEGEGIEESSSESEGGGLIAESEGGGLITESQGGGLITESEGVGLIAESEE